MDFELIKKRHSVRSYTEQKIENDVRQELTEFINLCNEEGNLNIKFITDEKSAFNTFLAHYGKFENVSNYIVMIGEKTNGLEERCGYYGEKIVLKAQELGLNTCWVGITYGKRKVPYKLKKNEKIIITISIGYGKNQGKERKTKNLEDVSKTLINLPEWYINGIRYSLYAPTAMNQQKFKFELIDENIVSLTTKRGFFTKVDLGIIRYHFELGANTNNFKWKID